MKVGEAVMVLRQAFPEGHTYRGVVDDFLKKAEHRLSVDMGLYILNMHADHIVEEGIDQLERLHVIWLSTDSFSHNRI